MSLDIVRFIQLVLLRLPRVYSSSPPLELGEAGGPSGGGGGGGDGRQFAASSLPSPVGKGLSLTPSLSPDRSLSIALPRVRFLLPLNLDSTASSLPDQNSHILVPRAQTPLLLASGSRTLPPQVPRFRTPPNQIPSAHDHSSPGLPVSSCPSRLLPDPTTSSSRLPVLEPVA